jgi:hypothetical protein
VMRMSEPPELADPVRMQTSETQIAPVPRMI